MSGYNTIDTDMAIATILSNFDSEYILATVQDSLNYKFRPYNGPMPNFPDILSRQFQAVLTNSPDYADRVNNVRDETYEEIINIIDKYYNLTFTKPFSEIQPVELYGICRTLYDVFVSNFTDHMIDFFVAYIINNVDSIYNYLSITNEPGIIKPKETGFYDPANFSNPKFILITANLTKVITNMTTYDIPLYEMLNYFVDPNSADRLSGLLQDNGDIFKNYYASYIIDQYTMSDVITCISLRFKSRVSNEIHINFK